MFGEAKAIGAFVGFGLDEMDAEIEGMILVDFGMDVGSKKTAPGTVSLVTRDGMVCISPAFPCLMQCDTMSVIVDVFRLPSIATRFGLY
jgi:hypothetical protein